MRHVVMPCLATALLLSCGGGGGSSSAGKLPTTISLSPHALTLTAGTSTTFSFGLTVVGGNSQTDFGFTWSATGGSITQPGQQPMPYEDGGTFTAPATPGTYTVTITSRYDPSKSDSATVTVIPAPTITRFSADTLDLDALAPAAVLTPVFADGTAAISPEVGPVTSGVPVTVHPNANTTYTLTVTNAAGTTRSQALDLKVWPLPKVSLTATPRITLGDTGVVTWAVTGATTVTLDQGIPGTAASGSWVVAPTADTTYTLTASNPRHAATASLAMQVLPVPTLNTFTLTPEIIHPGESAQLEATWTGGTGALTPAVTAFASGTPAPVSPATSTTYSLTVGNGLTSTTSTRTLRVASPGCFTRLGDLVVPRINPLLAPLPGGKVLVAGGVHPDLGLAAQLSAEVYDPATGHSRRLSSSLAAARSWDRTVAVNACAVALNDGRVLLLGAAPELFDPATETFRALATPTSLGSARPDRALVLGDGRVLFTGLEGTGKVHVFDPGTEAFTAVPLKVARFGQALTLLGDGTVLISGGDPNAFPDVGTCERFDPITNACTLLPGSWAGTRRNHEAFLGADGRVQLWGGLSATPQGWAAFNGAVTSVDPATGSQASTSIPTLPLTGTGPTVIHRLADGRTLLAQPRLVAIHDPVANTFLPAENEPALWVHSAPFQSQVPVPVVPDASGGFLLMGGEAEEAPRVTRFAPAQAYRSPFTSLRTAALDYGIHTCALTDGRILITDEIRGTAPKVLDPATGQALAAGPLATPCVNATLVALPGGGALAIGGSHTDPNTRAVTNLDLVQRFDPATRTWSLAGKLAVPRPLGPNAAVLKNGTVVVAGGTQGTGAAWGELFDPATGTSRAVDAPPQTLGGFWVLGAVPDGRALAAGANRIFLLDPVTLAWTPTPIATTLAYASALVVTRAGTVLIHNSAAAQTVDLTQGTCTSVPLGLDYVSLQASLANGLVLVGGQLHYAYNDDRPALALLNPATGMARVLPLPRLPLQTLAPLPDGRVFLLYGDQGTSEILDLAGLLP